MANITTKELSLTQDQIEQDTEIASKEPLINPKNSAFNKDFGTTAGTVTEGNDSRLSDTRDPNPHTHTKSEISDFIEGDYATPSDVSNLQTQINNIPDEVQEYANFAGFPGTGTTATLFIATDTGVAYRWTGSQYDPIGTVINDSDDITQGVLNLFVTPAEKAAIGNIPTDTGTEISSLQTQIDALDSVVILKGTWDASSGSFPASTEAGWSYIVSVAGTIDSVSFNVNDRIVSLSDNASASVYLSNWHKLDYTDEVLSVAGQTGVVSLDKSDVSLDQVDNTSDANKPISTATQTALDGKEVSGVASGLMSTHESTHDHSQLHSHINKTILDATTASFTVTDETKLDGIEANATADQTGAEIKVALEGESDTNTVTDSEKAAVGNLPADTNSELTNLQTQINGIDVPVEIQEYANFAALPGTGESNTLYITLDNGIIYRWTGSAYQRPSSDFYGTSDEITEGSTQLFISTTDRSKLDNTPNNTNAALSGKSDTGHTHTISEITDAGNLASLDTVGPTQIESTSVTPGSYTNVNITVDADGRITAAANGLVGSASDKGFYATATALTTAYPTGSAGDFAIVGETDSFWTWNVEGVEWVDTDETATGSGATNLSNSLTATTVQINSDTGSDTIVPAATPTLAGVQSAADKSKLNGIESGAQVNTVDSVNGQTGAVTLDKSDVGLSNVDNTSDANKPVSTAQQAALDGKATSAQGALADSAIQPEDIDTLAELNVVLTDATLIDTNDSRLSDARTPTTHSHTPSEVGLSNVDNTSDANKPVSTAQQAALDNKSDLSHTHGQLHDQGTDQSLDFGGANQVTAVEAKTAYDHSQVAHAPSDAEANVQSDWNAVSGDAQILNKPIIPTTIAELDTAVTGTELDGIKTKTDHISVTQAVDLDSIESRVNELDASVVLKGTWDASSGSFPISSKSGESWIVSVAGTVDGVEFSINDRIIAIVDAASTTTYADNWLKADYSDIVSSVNGQTGAVVLDKSGVGLSNVDNTSDVAKPISSATQNALDKKVNNYLSFGGVGAATGFLPGHVVTVGGAFANATDDTAAGMYITSAVGSGTSFIQVNGVRGDLITLTLADWKAVIDDGADPVPGETYWLSTEDGKITRTMPSNYIQAVCSFISTTVAVIVMSEMFESGIAGSGSFAGTSDDITEGTEQLFVTESEKKFVSVGATYKTLDTPRDGATDNTNALTTFISTINNGDKVIIPPGEYLTGSLQFTGLTDVEIDMRGAVFTNNASAGTFGSDLGTFAWADFSSNEKCAFLGGEFIGTASNEDNVRLFTNTSCLFDGQKHSGAISGNAYVAGGRGSKNKIRNFVIDGALCTSAVRGFWLGHYTAEGHKESFLTLENSLVYDCDATGVVQFGDYNRIIGNTVHDNNGSGIITTGASSIFSTGCLIANNVCFGNAFHGIQGDAAVGALTRGITIANNICYSNAVAGIYMNLCRDWATFGNQCFNNGSRGIQLEDASDGIISQNTCFDNQGVLTQAMGIYVVPGFDLSRVSIQGNTTNGMTNGIYIQQNGALVLDAISVTGNVSCNNSSHGLWIADATPGNMTNFLVANNMLVGNATASRIDPTDCITVNNQT